MYSTPSKNQTNHALQHRFVILNDRDKVVWCRLTDGECMFAELVAGWQAKGHKLPEIP